MDIYMYIQAHDDIPKCLENCQEGGCQITNLYISGTLSLSCPIWQCLGSSGCYLFFMVAMTTIWMPLSLHLLMVLNSGQVYTLIYTRVLAVSPKKIALLSVWKNITPKIYDSYFVFSSAESRLYYCWYGHCLQYSLPLCGS